MALDGITISAIVYELNNILTGGRIVKFSQPEKDELQLTIKNNSSQYKLLISAGASLPLIYITENSKSSPMVAPNFCMVLRKHINNGKILSIVQPELERVIHFEIEHLNELGDIGRKILTIELMGKHSNIIFCNDENMIIDSIKHINSQVSSIREVLPGRQYFIPQTSEKCDPLNLTFVQFQQIARKALESSKALYTSLTGISPIIAEEVCNQASIDSTLPINTLTENQVYHLYNTLMHLLEKIKNHQFQPCIMYEKNVPKDFSPFPLSIYNDLTLQEYESMSQVLEVFYREKNDITRVRQKTVDLRQIIQNALSKNYKKYDLQLKQLNDTEKRDKYKVYGELITAYGYTLQEGARELTALNYYTNEEITIPLDKDLSPIENAKKYFERYNKLKRTYDALLTIIKETEDEIAHLESISNALDISIDESDILQVKEELIEYGYIRRKYKEKKQKTVNKPLHYLSSDGHDIYVGKNNFQNEFITFKQATGNDWWFHAKGIPGSHVIVKTNGDTLPDSTFEDAAKLAAFYSKGRGLEKVEIDYTQKKNIKKPNGGKPGFVIYHTNYSLVIEPDISHIKKA